MMKNLPKILIQSVNQHGEADHGQKLCIEVTDSAGPTFVLMIPHQLEAEFLARFQGAAGYAAKARSGAADPATLNALAVASADMSLSENGMIVLRTQLQNGMTMNLALGPEAVSGFRSALAQMDAHFAQGGPARGQ